MENELPKLQTKQLKFVTHYIANNMEKPAEAYIFAYDCKNMSKESISVEAQKLLKNPKISLWLELARQNTQKVIKEELKYSITDCFNELEDMKALALCCRDKYSNPSMSTALKAVELKGKLAGLFSDKTENNINVGVEMPTMKFSGKELEFKIGKAHHSRE